MGSVVVPLTMLAAGAALVYVGITNPAGGAFAGLGNLIKGQPNTKAATDTTGFAATVADLTAVADPTPASGTTPASSVTGTTATSDPTRAKVIATAQTWLGVPYVFGGNTRKGIDCSGLTLRVYDTVGIHLPRVSYLQAKRGRRVATPQPGDLVAFGAPVHHVGIYIGSGNIIHAPHPGTVVRVEPVWHTEPVQYRDLLTRKTKTKTRGVQA